MHKTLISCQSVVKAAITLKTSVTESKVWKSTSDIYPVGAGDHRIAVDAPPEHPFGPGDPVTLAVFLVRAAEAD